MTAHTAPRWPLAAAGGIVGTFVAAATMVAVTRSSVTMFDGGMAVTFLVIGLLGALLARRRPDNRIGPLLIWTGVPMQVYALAVACSEFGGERSDLPLAWIASWATTWVWMPSITMLALAVLVFPTGAAPSPRWRIAQWLFPTHVGLVVATSLLLLPEWELRSMDAAALSDIPGGLALELVGNLPLPILLLLAGAGLVVRFRRSRGVERLQLRWLRLAFGMLVVVALSPFVVAVADPLTTVWYAVGVQLAVLGVPAAMTLAVLRYRLYEIDRLVSRTLSYAIVTASLVGIYLTVVVAVQVVLRPVAGESDLGVALATLAAAAAFRPLVGRLRGVVDRRFDRAAYDARATVQSFGERLRDDVDVSSVAGDLRRTADEILHPVAVGVWLPGGESS